MPETYSNGGGIAAPMPRSVRFGMRVADVLPLLASVLIHLTVIMLGLAAVHAVRHVVASASKEQLIIPDMGAMTSDPVGGIPHPGITSDPDTNVAQPNIPVDQSAGVNQREGHDLSNALSDGTATEPADSGLAVGGNRVLGSRLGMNGQGGDGGALAPFGVPGGSGDGPKCVFLKCQSTNARRIAFVCDASGSMMSKFDLLRVELRRAVGMLRPPQAFSVIFFQETTCSASDPRLLIATPEAKRKANDFIDRTAPRSGTDPLPAIRLAFQQGADLIYLLTDGDFPDNKIVIDELRKLNPTKKVKVNTLAFIDRDESYEKVLKQIAQENGGMFRFVAEADLRQ